VIVVVHLRHKIRHFQSIPNAAPPRRELPNGLSSELDVVEERPALVTIRLAGGYGMSTYGTTFPSYRRGRTSCCWNESGLNRRENREGALGI